MDGIARPGAVLPSREEGSQVREVRRGNHGDADERDPLPVSCWHLVSQPAPTVVPPLPSLLSDRGPDCGGPRRSPKAFLLHFKRFLVTHEAKGGADGEGNADGKENGPATPPRMLMVLRKNKVRLLSWPGSACLAFSGSSPSTSSSPCSRVSGSGKDCPRGIALPDFLCRQGPG